MGETITAMYALAESLAAELNNNCLFPYVDTSQELNQNTNNQNLATNLTNLAIAIGQIVNLYNGTNYSSETQVFSSADYTFIIPNNCSLYILTPDSSAPTQVSLTMPESTQFPLTIVCTSEVNFSIVENTGQIAVIGAPATIGPQSPVKFVFQTSLGWVRVA